MENTSIPHNPSAQSPAPAAANAAPSDRAAPLLESLRAATAASHQRLDASFGSLDLTDRAGFARFLAAHFIGLAPLAPLLQEFASRELDRDAPDMLSMLRRDLAEMGIAVEDLPRLEAGPTNEGALEPLGVSYVILGSRLGLAMIRKQDYWGRSHGMASRYMEDEDGLSLWRAFAGLLRGRSAPDDETRRQCASAVTAFDLFGHAFDAGNGIEV